MWETYVVTAYCACLLCTGHTHGITKSGAKAQAHHTVACSSQLLGATVHIAGIGRRVCQDTGSMIKHRHIDIYVETHEEALQFGRHEMRIKVEKRPNGKL